MAGLSFIACILFGTGIGLLFGRPDVGAPIGVGAGFLVMGLIGARVIEPTPITISLPRSFGRIFLAAVGALVIVCGLFILYNVDILYPWVAGIGTVVMGLVIFLGGLLGRRQRK
ncbi:hypothetical protein KAV79_06125 [Candidatus Aerophobetes bacterium]|nr:hypothetical protein [Candidatus Aerophobetes bacterium]